MDYIESGKEYILLPQKKRNGIFDYDGAYILRQFVHSEIDVFIIEDIGSSDKGWVRPDSVYKTLINDTRERIPEEYTRLYLGMKTPVSFNKNRFELNYYGNAIHPIYRREVQYKELSSRQYNIDCEYSFELLQIGRVFERLINAYLHNYNRKYTIDNFSAFLKKYASVDNIC